MPLEPGIDLGFELAEGAAESGMRVGGSRSEGGRARAEQSVVGASQEECGAKPGGSHFVAMGVGNAADEAVDPEATQVIGHAAR